MEAGYGTTDFWPGQKDRTQDRAKVSGRRDGFRVFWRQNHQGYGACHSSHVEVRGGVSSLATFSGIKLRSDVLECLSMLNSLF